MTAHFTTLENETSEPTPSKQNQNEISYINSQINSNIEDNSAPQETSVQLDKIIPIKKQFSEAYDAPFQFRATNTTIDFITPKTKRFKRLLFKTHGNLLLIFCSRELTDYIDPIIVIGPQWYMFILGIVLLVVSELFLYSLLWQRSSQLFCFIGVMIDIVHILVYCWLFISNPGVILSQAKNDKNACPHCKCVRNKEFKQKHCKECNACFKGLDHHCPWISKCVGTKNVHVFRSFLVLSLFVFFWFIVTLVTYE